MCTNLKTVEFSEGLERIGNRVFYKSALENIVLPSSIRIVCGQAFAKCEKLRSVYLNEGLEVLGAEEVICGDVFKGDVFSDSTLESITIPATLTKIEYGTRTMCKSTQRIEFLEGKEVLGKDQEDTSMWNTLFRECGVKEIILPSTLREMSPDIFRDCKDLKTVRVAKGSQIKVRKFVGITVRVRRK